VRKLFLDIKSRKEEISLDKPLPAGENGAQVSTAKTALVAAGQIHEGGSV
jgi:hypothetical protein